jgi:hypothetical protein
MKTTPPVNPFDSSRYIGTISELRPTFAKVVLSDGGSVSARADDFVTVKCGEWILFGRLTRIQSNRYAINQTMSEDDSAAPAMAEIDLLATAARDGCSAGRGIAQSPHLGNAVYLATPQLLEWLFRCSQIREIGEGGVDPVMLELMSLGDVRQLGLAPEHLFGRHCAVLGATGTGKSWTIARLIEESARYPAKMVLFDPTGEFHTLKSGVRHVCV